MDNSDFVFIANIKAFRQLLLLYGFKFSMFSFAKVMICKKEIYLQLQDKFLKKSAYINLCNYETISCFTITVIDFSNNSYDIFSKKIDSDILISYGLIELLKK